MKPIGSTIDPLDHSHRLRRQLGVLLIEGRKALGMSQRELAKRAGVSINTLRGAEHATTWPHIDALEAMLAVLGCELRIGRAA